MLGLDTALTKLAAVDERLARVVELRYFAGLSEMEIAALLVRSERSIRRDWQKAKLFLLAALQGDEDGRSEEHTSELQSLMRTSYSVFCLKKKNHNTEQT